ncbi:MAG: cytochrome c4 [Gammaproteobacteria bacterium]|nr:cytochrome c4 [Gammaproteobacteria bacterium]
MILAVSLLTLNTQADNHSGNIEQGRAKSAVCSACHGVDGNSINPEWPSLAGQHPKYLVQRLQAYKAGEVKTPLAALMNAQAMALSAQDMADLAAYFASQTVTPGAADAALVEAGSVLYRMGNEEREIASCAACHGPRGRGNPLSNVPAIAGQRSAYSVAQLKAFANGTRDGGLNGMMHDVSKSMSEDDMKAVASFMQGLH